MGATHVTHGPKTDVRLGPPEIFEGLARMAKETAPYELVVGAPAKSTRSMVMLQNDGLYKAGSVDYLVGA
jgi:hypothetical protein